jgi:hypothetical protein
MPYKKRRNTDEESTKNVLAAYRELDEHSEKKSSMFYLQQYKFLM